MLQFINPLLHKALQRISPCQLCNTEQQQIHSVCADCWQQLPWLKSTVQRQEM